MTTITNKHGLPLALVEAVRNDPYRGGGDITATALIDAPYRRLLFKQHATKIEADVSERIWSLLGQAVHHILERAGTDTLVEERLFADMKGWKLSGQFDRLHLASKTLSDYKVTTTYKAKGDPNWTRQLNILRWLAHQNGLTVEHLEIVAIFRDWRASEVDRNPDYPKTPAAVIPIDVWPLEQTEMYIADRVGLHQAMQAQDNRTAPICSDEERWYSGTTYALMKDGGKRAVKVVDDLNLLSEESVKQEGYHVEIRSGRYRRCESYCEVARWCTAYATPEGA